ncbi:contractile injection system tape measure protein [Aquimarina algiphila]|uniref:contractile injection system tape measure protein n=1 Tax=Aquimarina algiphila TaxID=2047982 RepID=UPI00232D1F34|nr:contractile injection system tape measure protein [Aquimarina algiphila]
MKPYDNIIRQLFFDINVNGNTSSVSLSEDVTQYCTTELCNAIEKKIQKYYSDEYVFIDSLEIDLGNISFTNWENVLKERLDFALQEQLKKSFLLQKDSKTISSFSTNTSHKPEHVLADKISRIVGTNKVDKLSQLSRRKNHIDVLENAFMFYFEKGYFPWWFDLNVLPQIGKKYIHQLDVKKTKKLVSILQKTPNTRIRFLTTFQDEEIAFVLSTMGVSKEIPLDHSPLYKVFEKTVFQKDEEKEFRIVFWETIIIHHDLIKKTVKKPEIQFLKYFLSNTFFRKKKFLRNFRSDKIVHFFLNEIQGIWPQVPISKFKEEIASILLKDNETENVKIDLSSAHFTNPNTNRNVKTSEQEKTTDNLYRANREEEYLSGEREVQNNVPESTLRIEEEEGVYVHYAGIALLYPFLGSFFKNLSLLENNNWKTESSAQKAIRLLAFLSTGNTGYIEYECVLFKHLCGLPWDTVMDHRIELNSFELNEARSLLKSVIQHWDALKNTSVDGLREGFINRSGKLLKTETGWQLYVEQKAQDILLQHLPWGIGMVKFPWMKELLQINWI